MEAGGQLSVHFQFPVPLIDQVQNGKKNLSGKFDTDFRYRGDAVLDEVLWPE